MAIQTIDGTSISISASTPATIDAAGYVALTYTQVKEVTDIGEFGRTYEVVTHTPLDTRADRKFKGTYNEGALTLTLARDMEDAGQTILYTALDSDDDHSFKITWQNGDITYFTGKAVSDKQSGSKNTMRGGTVNVEINSGSIVNVAI